MKAIPYLGAAVVGAMWHTLHPAVAIATLAICAFLIYTDSRD